MAARMKEDEKNEKTIRALLKLPANRRCINCNNLVPQYVCTNFWTFVCTNCSGAHREFTHRVKSISMAKFTSEEVKALEEGGNERAREIYFKEWDPHRNSYPDSSNPDRLREFIKRVYVDRRFTGERSSERPPRGKDDKEDYNQARKSESYQGPSRSPPYNDDSRDRRSYSYSGRNDERNSRYAYGEQSPGYDQGDYRKSPVDDRYRDDRASNTSQNARFEDRRLAEVRKPDTGSPNHQKDSEGFSPPAVRPVREIAGEDAPPLRVVEPPKKTAVKALDPPPLTKRASSGSTGSADANSAPIKVANVDSAPTSLASLIDFSVDSEPPAPVAPAAPAAPPQAAPPQVNPSPANGDGWASFDAFDNQKASQVAGNANSLNPALSQLSFSESASTNNQTIVSTPANQVTQVSFGHTLLPQQQQSLPFTPSTAAPINNQGTPELTVGGSSFVQSSAGPSAQTSQLGTNPLENAGALSASGIRPPARKELPADFFTSLYPAATATAGWQRAPQYGMGMGYAMQYPGGMVVLPNMQPVAAYAQPMRPANPFDLGNDSTSYQAPMYPSMGPPQVASLQGAPANMTGSPRWAAAQQPLQQMGYPRTAAPGPYMMQQIPNNMPQLAPNVMPQMIQPGNFGAVNPQAAFGNLAMDQQAAAARYAQPNTTNSYGSVSTNPFG